MGTGQDVLLCITAGSAHVTGGAAAIGFVLQSCIAHLSIDLWLLEPSHREMVS